MPSLDWAKDWAKNATHPVIEYERKFGPLPEGLLKLSTMLTVATSGRLFADLTEALRVGKPIEHWSSYARPSRWDSA